MKIHQILKKIFASVAAVSMLSMGVFPYIFTPPTDPSSLAKWKIRLLIIASVAFLAFMLEQFFQGRHEKAVEKLRERKDQEDARKWEELMAVINEVKMSVTAESEPLPLLDNPHTGEKLTYQEALAPAEQLPNILMNGYQYLWLKPDANFVFRADPNGRKSLLFIFTNEPDSDGNGVDVSSLRAQINFRWDTGYAGPSFSPLPWLDEELAFVDLHLGVQKKLVVGMSYGQLEGWGSYRSGRIDSRWAKGDSPLSSEPIPMNGKLKVRLLASINGRSRVVWMACFSWRIEHGPNHPWFHQIDCKEMEEGNES